MTPALQERCKEEMRWMANVEFSVDEAYWKFSRMSQWDLGYYQLYHYYGGVNQLWYGFKGRRAHICSGDSRKTSFSRWALKSLGECVIFLQDNMEELYLSAILAQGPRACPCNHLKVMGRDETLYMLKFTILVYDCTQSIHLFNKFLFISLI